MTQDIQPVKRPRGRPRKNPLPEITESDDSVAVMETDVLEAEAVEFNFVPTGNPVKDRALKGAIHDAPSLFHHRKYTIPQKDMDIICNSANPAGECEKYAISKFVKDPEKVVPVLLAVKKLLTNDRNGLTVLKAYESNDLKSIKNISGAKNLIDRAVAQMNIDTTTVEVKPIDDTPIDDTPIDDPIVDTITEPITEIVPVIDTVPVTEPVVETIAPEFVKGQVVTNPADASQTWTIGSRGRKPLWFLALNVKVVPSKVVDEIVTVEPDPVKNTDSGLECNKLTNLDPGSTVFNPEDKSQIYVIGTRGRPSKWFTNLLENGSNGHRVKILPPNIIVNPEDTMQIFNISKRGRRANWVIKYLKNK